MTRKDRELQNRVRRNAAMSRPELRQSPAYTSTMDGMPEPGKPCTVWAVDENGPDPYRIPFGVAWDGQRWHNITLKIPLEVKIVGWNYRSIVDEKGSA